MVAQNNELLFEGAVSILTERENFRSGYIQTSACMSTTLVLSSQPMRTIQEPFVQSPTVLFFHTQSKHQKHQAFEAELHANADRIRGVIDMGNSLIERGACAGSEDAVKVDTTCLKRFA